ncbi:hypothetical protein KY342_03915 [Candidatus Woesearchaeota archaeon]|nr:hypothetical protein [Candidatus Woesearchaeota archaeon]
MILTRKGQKILEEDCEEAFKEVEFCELQSLERSLGMSHTVQRLYRGLHRGIVYLWDSNPRATDLHALLIYEVLEENPHGIKQLRNFGQKTIELLEAYLVDRGLIE